MRAGAHRAPSPFTLAQVAASIFVHGSSPAIGVDPLGQGPTSREDQQAPTAIPTAKRALLGNTHPDRGAAVIP